MPRYERILCPVDFSESSEAAFRYALYLAEQFDGRVEVLHVYSTPVLLYPELVVWSDADRTSLGAVMQQQAQEQMDSMLANLEPHLLQRVIPEVVLGEPVATVLERAEQRGYDVIVVGTHGRTGLAHLVLGSVAERIVRRAPCPVLTVRAQPKPSEARQSA
jgi:nucleotide-binding universal stress UspA family protein